MAYNDVVETDGYTAFYIVLSQLICKIKMS